MGLCGVVEADWELFWNSWSVGSLGERLYEMSDAFLARATHFLAHQNPPRLSSPCGRGLDKLPRSFSSSCATVPPSPPTLHSVPDSTEVVKVSMASAGTCPVTGRALFDPHARYVAGRGRDSEHGFVGVVVCSLCDGLNEAHLSGPCDMSWPFHFLLCSVLLVPSGFTSVPVNCVFLSLRLVQPLLSSQIFPGRHRASHTCAHSCTHTSEGCRALPQASCLTSGVLPSRGVQRHGWRCNP